MTYDPNDGEFALELHRRTLARARQFWIWMALLPGLLTLPLFFAGVSVFLFRSRADMSGGETTAAYAIPVLAFLWIVRCVFAIVETWRYESPSGKTWMGITWLAALMLANASLTYGFLWAACAFHPIK